MSLGIRHIEMVVSDLEKSVEFYSKLFSLIGWKQVDKTGFKYENTKIYLKKSIGNSIKRDSNSEQRNILGARHMCFDVNDTKTVDIVSKFLNEQKAKIIRGPLEVFDEWTPNGGYYTVDFYDLDGYILEVAYVNHK
jgi:catechol 2,3-dioxygenase-like lactoylglutathione lyase family enzyme